MIILDATTKTIEVILSGAITTNQLPVVVSYVDISSSTMDTSAVGESDTVTNSTSYVTALAAPAASHTRKMLYFSVFNADTAIATVTVVLNNNGTRRILRTNTLAIGDTLEYVDGVGWIVSNFDGARRVVSSATSPQVVETKSGAVITGVTAFILDDTIPQNTEGFEVFTAAAAATNINSKFLIQAQVQISHSVAGVHVGAAFFIDGSANAIASDAVWLVNSGDLYQISLETLVTVGDLSSHTFHLRCGGTTGATLTINGTGGGRLLGGVCYSWLRVTEILPSS